MIATKPEAEIWSEFASDYARKVFSPTSFPERRARILRDFIRGSVLDLGCGPLGHVLSDLALRPATRAIGTDFSLDMLEESRRRTAGIGAAYVLADHRSLPVPDRAIDCVVSVNSIVPQTRAEVDTIFAEISRILRKGGRLIALLPAFEMSIAAREGWRMKIDLDMERHREWDTSGWQCFFTVNDIEELMKRHSFASWRLERMTFSAPDEASHIREVYAGGLEGVPQERLLGIPLFEHLLTANR